MTPTEKNLNALLLFSLILFVVSSVFSISVSTIAIVMGILIWVIQTTLKRDWGKVRVPLGMPIGLYFLACGISLFFAADFDASFSKSKKLLEPFIFFLIVNYFMNDRFKEFTQKFIFWIERKEPPFTPERGTSTIWQPILYLWFLAAMVSGLFAYYQIFTEIDPMGEYRASGPMGSSMTFSGLLMMVLVMMTSRLILGSTRPSILVFLFLITLGAFIISHMRSGWLAYFLAVVGLLYLKNRLWAAIAPLLIIMMLFVSPPFIKERVFSILPTKENPAGLLADKSFMERRQIWNAGLDIFKDNPVFGCGFDCTYNVRKQFIEKHPILNQASALHSNFMQLLVDVGLFGLAAWIFIWVQFFLKGFKIFKALGRESNSFWIVSGSLAAVMGFLIVGCVESNFFDTEIAMVVFFLMALPFSFDNEAMAKSPSVASPRSP